MKKFFARLKTLRGEATLLEVSKRVGLNLKTYQYYEAGTRKPHVNAILQIAESCAVSSDWLLGLTDDPTPRKSSGGVHINGVSHSVVNGHAVNSSISNGVGKDDSFVDRLKALEKAVEDLNVAVFRTEPAKRPVR